MCPRGVQRRVASTLTRLQQALSRKQRGSNNRKKAVVKVARAHAKVADTRRDWQHKLSTSIIRDNQAVYVEDLCVVGLGRTRLAKSVHDAGWTQFVNMIEYKATRAGRTFGKIGRFEPTSQRCSACGRIDGKKPLAVGRAESLNACGARVRPASVPAPRREAGIHPDAARSARSVEGISVL